MTRSQRLQNKHEVQPHTVCKISAEAAPADITVFFAEAEHARTARSATAHLTDMLKCLRKRHWSVWKTSPQSTGWKVLQNARHTDMSVQASYLVGQDNVCTG